MVNKVKILLLMIPESTESQEKNPNGPVVLQK